MAMTVSSTHWGTTPEGVPVELFTLANGSGMSVSIATYGGTVVSLKVPDPGGRVRDVALGFDDLAGYLADTMFVGSLVGRTANRTGQARVNIQGKRYDLDRNHGRHTLHGGSGGFHARVWEPALSQDEDCATLSLKLTSPHMDQGYPGELLVTASYTLGADMSLTVEFQALTDRPTLVDPTTHIYFNLAGHDAGSCRNHMARFNATSVLELDGEQIPTGRILPVAGTGLDLSFERPLAHGLDSGDPRMQGCGGFDHYYPLTRTMAHPVEAAVVTDPASGRRMAMETNCAGFQFYTGNAIPMGTPGKDGAAYGRHAGFCLEPHGFPDAANHPSFAQALLLPGETYARKTIYRFSTGHGES